MARFYVSPEAVVDKTILMTGPDVNHVRNVLRCTPGDTLTISDGQGLDYYCIIRAIAQDQVELEALYKTDSAYELPVEVVLFQGLPKGDKMELVIQKAVELGASEVVPVAMARSIVKLDAKQAGKKTERWRRIAEAAAKQAKRGIVPKVSEPCSFKEMCGSLADYDLVIVPYENAEGIAATKALFEQAGRLEQKGRGIAVVIGPEGGFDEDEINRLTAMKISPVTLGRRILRTETAGLAVLSNLMIQLEEERNASQDIDR